MALRLLPLFSLLLAATAALAQSADDYFAGGAQAYISNNIPRAREAVDQGLKVYPNDVKLKKLDELLKQQQKQQQQQGQGGQSQQNQNQSQQNQKQNQRQQQQKDQESNQKKPENGSRKNQEQDSSNQGKKEQPPQNQPQSSAGQMTPQQAKQLLDSQKNDEMMLPAARKPKNEPHTPLKDW